MNIRDFIKDVLQRHQVLVLPGLGGFVAEYEDAIVDQKQNKFTPPSKKIKFDSKITKDENHVLERYLIITFNIKKEKAVEEITHFIEKIKSDLKSGKEVFFKDLGFLKQNENNEIEFIFKADENLLLDSFGFDSFTHKSIDKPKKTPQAMVKNTKNKKIKKRVLIPAIGIPSVLILIVLALVFFTDIEKNLLKWEKTKTETIEILGETDLSKSLDDQTEPGVALQLPDNDTIDAKYANCTQFIIIAGSFTQYKNAENLRQNLINKGFHNPEIILSGEKNYRVALKTFSDRKLALEELERLKDSEKKLNVWLLSI